VPQCLCFSEARPARLDDTSGAAAARSKSPKISRREKAAPERRNRPAIRAIGSTRSLDHEAHQGHEDAPGLLHPRSSRRKDHSLLSICFYRIKAGQLRSWRNCAEESAQVVREGPTLGSISRRTIQSVNGTASQFRPEHLPSLFGQAAPMGSRSRPCHRRGGRLAVDQRALGVQPGHGGSPDPPRDHPAASWGAKAPGHEPAIKPRASARPKGAELHGAEGEGSELG